MSTSAYDLALVFRAAMADPTFAAAAATERAELPGPPGQPSRPVNSDNTLLLNYPGAIGAKSGFTDDARHTFVGAAQRDGRRLVAVLLHGENQPIRQPKQVARLLDYGFGLGPVRPAGHLVEREQPRVADEPPPPPQPEPLPNRAEPHPPRSSAIVAPVAILGVAVAILLGVLTGRRRRAASPQNNERAPDRQD
jgi:D-alanyl-D-alanine carboxypeptidase (penicillin-binding protein 5/6)